ncbi:MAG: hypothetical protein NVS9B4_13180 [Candidatus Acidiferrum sp.]
MPAKTTCLAGIADLSLNLYARRHPESMLFFYHGCPQGGTGCVPGADVGFRQLQRSSQPKGSLWLNPDVKIH